MLNFIGGLAGAPDGIVVGACCRRVREMDVQ